MKNERPILFSTPMVKAILAGNKTQTRRVVDKQMPADWNLHRIDNRGAHFYWNPISRAFIPNPYGNQGDMLWVRENWLYVMREHAHDLLEGASTNSQYVFQTSFHDDWIKYAKEKYGYKWKPSIHMPKSAARIWLHIESIRVERLQDISRGDCMSEGCPFPNIAKETDPKKWFSELWQSINGEESWNSNPWVWAITFKVLSTTGLAGFVQEQNLAPQTILQ